MAFQNVLMENWLLLGGVALLIAWAVSLVVYVLSFRARNRTMDTLMGEFAERFPHRCFLCAYYRFILDQVPPRHNCNDWTAER